METLTHEDVTALTRHFTLNEHEFTRGYTYITESAVANRIEEVDPAWTWEIVNEWTRDNQAICAGRLTIKGVSRDGVGMQPLTIVSSKDGKVLEGTEPEKSAATDALKRAARLFGIGRYLLDLPGWVKELDTLDKWLSQQRSAQSSNGGSTQPTPRIAPPNPTGVPTPSNPQTSANGNGSHESTESVWPSTTTLETVLTHLQRGTGVIDMSMAEFARLAGIDSADNLTGWKATFSSGKAAYEAAMKQFEAEQKRATAKAWTFNRDALVNHQESILCYPQKNHREHTIDLLRGSGIFNDVATIEEAAKRVRSYYDFRTTGNLDQAAAIQRIKEFAAAF